MKTWMLGAAVCVVVAAAALAAEEAATFTKAPAVRVGDEGTVIEFAVDRATDVAVRIEDAKGKVVRHLVAGVLGANAPAPLKPGSLAQSVLWDGKDDRGKPVPPGTYTVRVGLGLTA